MKKFALAVLALLGTFGLSEAQIVNASQYFNHTSNTHLRGKVRLWNEPSSVDNRVSHGLGTEHFHNTYGPGNAYAHTIGHKFYIHGNEVVAQFGFGGAGAPANRYTSYINGKLGIGTTNPGAYALAVNGTIRAKEIVVQTGWADFVFEDDYELSSLSEVEKHIKEKGHLKDIPSAKEVAEKGVNLGEMDAKLLQKIEELTLYTIEQEKKISILIKKIEEMNGE